MDLVRGAMLPDQEHVLASAAKVAPFAGAGTSDQLRADGVGRGILEHAGLGAEIGVVSYAIFVYLEGGATSHPHHTQRARYPLVAAKCYCYPQHRNNRLFPMG